jgi:hypothetical protein
MGNYVSDGLFGDRAAQLSQRCVPRDRIARWQPDCQRRHRILLPKQSFRLNGRHIGRHLEGILALSLAGVALLPGAELVSLTSGFQLEVNSHQVVGRSLVLETGSGTIEVQADQVASIEVLAHPTEAQNQRSPTLAQIGVQDPITLLSQASLAQGLPPNLVLSVAKVESGFQAGARSPKGAIGLMQLMPQTAAELGVSPERVEDNAAGGARYLRELLIRYRGDSRLALAAYNAGPGAVDRFRDVPPYPETQQYVEHVLREYARREAASHVGALANVAQTHAEPAVSPAGPEASKRSARATVTAP